MSMVKALVIVAHPDDEAIWMSGKIMRHKDWEWTIVSLCRKDDLDRKPKFFSACSYLNARGFISDLDDEDPDKNLPSLSEIINRLEPIVLDKCFDVVFTHGPNGEYGHKRHIEINRAVVLMTEHGLLDCKSLYEFSYIGRVKPAKCVPDSSADEIFILNEDEMKRKKYLINKVYCFNTESFEFLSCSEKETFNKVF